MDRGKCNQLLKMGKTTAKSNGENKMSQLVYTGYLTKETIDRIIVEYQNHRDHLKEMLDEPQDYEGQNERRLNHVMELEDKIEKLKGEL